jgi:DNA-binding CsgD family transcriptional regulator
LLPRIQKQVQVNRTGATTLALLRVPQELRLAASAGDDSVSESATNRPESPTPQVAHARRAADRPADARRHCQSKMLKTVLKQQIRIRGMRYKDIADQLEVSVMTVKRYLNSERVPVEVLEDIGACLGLGLLELAELAKADSGGEALDLELQQETALASDYALALMRLLLYSGMTVSEIMDEYDIDEPTVVGLLTRLDRLKLIELLPGNRVRIRGTRYVEWKRGGPIRHTIQNDIRDHFVDMDFAGTDAFFGYETVRLTRSSIRQLEDHMRNLVRQIRILHSIDQGAKGEDKQWCTLLVAHRETNWGFPVNQGQQLVPRFRGGPAYPTIRSALPSAVATESQSRPHQD